MSFVGIDSARYPGDSTMQLFKEKTNLAFCCPYLGPAPCHPETDWMPTLPTLYAQGWGSAPVFVGRQLTPQLAGGGLVLAALPLAAAQQGVQDGCDAVALMIKIGYSPGSWLWLDVENGPPIPPAQAAYIKSFCATVEGAGYHASVYVSHLLLASVGLLVPTAKPRLWGVKVASVDPHDASHYGNTFPLVDPASIGAFMWQFEENARIDVRALKWQVDLDGSAARDPSAP